MPLPRVLFTRMPVRCALLVVLFALLWFGVIHVSSKTVPTARRSAVAAAVMQTTGAQSLLVLRFDGNLNGEQGEMPTQVSTPLFQPGVSRQGVLADRNSRLTYPSSGNILATEGTIELWLKPYWEGGDTQSRVIFKYGASGGLRLSKEAGQLRFALNYANENGSLELDAVANIPSWQAGQWHHIAATWSNREQFIRLYVDGTLMSERSLATTSTLPLIDNTANPTLQLGGDGLRLPIVAVLDEVTISDAPRSSQEIASRMLRGITLQSATLTPPTSTVTMYPGWSFWQDLRYTAVTNIGLLTLPLQAATLTNSNADIATTDPVTGRIKAVAPGNATVTATLLGASSVITVNVLTPQQTATVETIDAALSTPRSDALYQVPVAIIRYFPTTDGTTLNATAAGFSSSLDVLKSKQTSVEKKLKFMLEEGSRFRGYANAAARASLGYKVVKIITVYEEIPPGFPTATSGVYFPDYKQIFQRWNVRDLVLTQGVKEIWLEQYANGRIALNESNLASPLTGDVSSSLRTNDDLPVYAKSYTVFGFNYEQFENEAARHHGHHLEALLTFANLRQDGDDTLFQEAFIGRNLDGAFLPGRCGKTDRPPNGTSNFDFNNATAVESDIEDWWPENTGLRTSVNNATWGRLPYAWPEPPTEKTEGQWYIYWRQAIPGLNNQITRLGTERMTNWWDFVGDWDNAMQTRLGLVKSLVCQYALSSTSLNLAHTSGEGSVNVTAGTGCTWSATSHAPWITIKPGSDNGVASGTVQFAVAFNAGATRTGTLTIQGQTFTITQAAAGACVAQRTLPAEYVVGQALPVSVQVIPAVSTQSYAVEETPPAGWAISGIDNNGQLDAVNGKVKWGPFFDATPRTLKYAVTPPTGTEGQKTFAGTVSVNGTSSTTCGATNIAAASLVHPADLSNNLRLEINELTAYGVAWKAGAAWSRPPSPVDINYLTNAGLLWKLGEVYHFDSTKSPPFAAGLGVNRQQLNEAGQSSPKGVAALTMAATEAPDLTSQKLLRAMGYMPGLGFGVVAAIDEMLAIDAASLFGGAAVASFSTANYVPGVGVAVTITVTPDASTQVYAVEDTPPPGWTVTNVNNGGAFDSTNRKVKWGAFFDNAARSLTYVVTPLLGETGTKTFVGSASFDGISVAVTGARTLPPAQLCTYALSAASQGFNASGGTGSFNLTTATNCSWNATSADTWIRLTQGNGNGNGAINFTVAANTGAARVGTISVGGQTFSINQSANATPTITPASALIRQQGASATAVTIATVGDAETATSDLVVVTTFVPTGLSVTAISNTNGTISAVVTASCSATPGTNSIGLRVTDALGAAAQANLTVNVLSNPNCFLQIADASGSDQRLGAVLLYNYYSSTLGNAAFENTQIRLTNTHETQDTAVRLYFVDAQTASVFSLFVCLAPSQTFSFLMSETDPSVTGHIIAIAVSKTTGCPTNFNFLAGSAALKLSTGHVATLGAIAMAALATTPTSCVAGNAAARLNFDGLSYSRLPRMLVVDNVGSLRDGNTTRLIVTRVGGSLMGTAGGMGTISGKIYNSNRATQDFTFSTTAPQFIGNLSASFPRLTTRLDTFINAGQSGWMKLWTDANWGIIGSVMNLPTNLRTSSGFVGGFNLQQGALASAVSLEVPISVPICQ